VCEQQWHRGRRKTNLELFGPAALAYLMDGPKPQPALDGSVPASVLEQLRRAGLINYKMVRQGSMTTAWWYMADEGEPFVADPPVRHSPRCDDPGIFDNRPGSR
jgi:hypothetical protein